MQLRQVGQQLRQLVARSGVLTGLATPEAGGARDAWRGLRRNRGFTVAAVSSVALAVGANAAIFSIVDALWFRPIPVHAPDRIGVVYKPVATSAAGGVLDVHQGVVRDALEELDAFAGVTFELAASDRLADWRPVVRMEGTGKIIPTTAVAHDYFQTLGVPVAGRFFRAGEDIAGAAPVGIISHAFWRTYFNSAPDVLGRGIPTPHGAITVIGITPPGFSSVRLGERADLWIPLGAVGHFSGLGLGGRLDRIMPLTIYARLRDGSSFGQAEAQVRAVTDPRATLVPLGHVRFRMRALSDTAAHVSLVRVLWSAAALVLLLGCVNLAALLLARAESRRHEFAVRLCLGASRRELVRLVLVEAMLICAAGFGLGLLARRWLIAGLEAFSLPSGLTIAELDPRLDVRVIAFAAIVAGVGSAIAVAGAVRLARSVARQVPTSATVSTPGPQSVRARRALLAAHVALSIALLGAAAALLVNVRHAMTLPLGFDRDKLLFAEVRPRLSAYDAPLSEPGSRLRVDYAELLGRCEALPGVRAVAYGSPVFGGPPWAYRQGIRVDGRREEVAVAMLRVGPGYLSAVGAVFLGGRDFAPEDRDRSVSPMDVLMARVESIRTGRRYEPPRRVPLAVVDSALAARLWPGSPAVGRQFLREETGLRYEVAGVVAPIVERTAGAREMILFEYLSLEDDNGLGTFQFVVRADSDARHIRASVVETIRQVFPDPLQVAVRSTDALVAAERVQEILGARLFSWFGAASALLGLAGVYGLVAFTMLRERRQSAIRLVLGASPASVRRRVVSETMTPVVAGAIAGLGLSIAFAEVLAALVAGIVFLDPTAYAAAAVAFVAAALLVAVGASRAPGRSSPLTDLLRTE